jgi:hypothetical protein
MYFINDAKFLQLSNLWSIKNSLETSMYGGEMRGEKLLIPNRYNTQLALLSANYGSLNSSGKETFRRSEANQVCSKSVQLSILVPPITSGL